MNYLVVEMQTNDNVTTTLTYQYNNYADAQQKYYTILSVAVGSTVDIHSAFIVDENAVMYDWKSFDHREPNVSEN